MKIEQAKTTVAKLWQLFPITLLIYKLLNLTKPKKKKKSLQIQQNITTFPQYLYFQPWWISV